MKLLAVLLLVAAGFGASAETLSIPAGGSMTVTDADWATFSAYTEVSVAAADGETPAGVLYLNTSQPPTMALTGGGRIVKTSASDWTMSRAQTGFTGDFEIEAGMVTVEDAAALGTNLEKTESKAGKIIVRDGATLHQYCLNAFGFRTIHLAGEGVTRDGVKKGALWANRCSTYPIQRVVLDDDAYYCMDANGAYLISGADLRNVDGPIIGSGTVQMNGHTLTGWSPRGYIFYQMSASFSGGEFVFKGTDTSTGRRTLLVRDSGYLPTGDFGTTMKGYTTFNFHNNAPIQKGTLTVDGDMRMTWTSNNSSSLWRGWVTNNNNWVGSVVFANPSSKIAYRDSGSYNGLNCFTLGGKLVGAGSIEVGKNGDYYSTGRFNIAGSSSADEYTGLVSVSNTLRHGTLALFRTNSLPNYANISCGFGSIALEMLADGDSRWTPAAIAAFNDNVSWGKSSYLTVDTTYAPDHAFTLGGQEFDGLVAGDVLRLGHDSAGTLVLTGRFEKALSLATVQGTLKLGEGFEGALTNTFAASANKVQNSYFDSQFVLDGAKRVTTGFDGLAVGATRGNFGNENTIGRMLVTNSTWLTTYYPASGSTANAADGSVLVGWYKRGVLQIEDGAVVTNRFVIGSGTDNMAAPNNGGGNGALYVFGGQTTCVGYGPSHLTSSAGIGSGGEGYIGVTGGSLDFSGPFTLGGYGVGVMHVRGGSVTTSANWKNAAGAIRLGGCNGGRGVLYVTNGTFRSGAEFCGASGNSNNRAFITADAGGRIECLEFNLCCGYENDSNPAKCVLNALRGGVLRGTRFFAWQKNFAYDACCVNLDGGVIEVSKNDKDIWSSDRPVPLFGRRAASTYAHDGLVRVYGGGATVDTCGFDAFTEAPILAADGQGVKSVPWTEATGYISAPYVTIKGDGYGASAVADFDERTGTVKGIIVTSAGWGYTTATATVSAYGGGTSKSGIACVLGDNDTDGAFTKAGAGTLDLRVTNGWNGVTTVAGGTLKTSVDYALPSNAVVRLAGGDLDLGNAAACITNLEYRAGGGRVLNAANAILPSTFTLSTTVEDVLAEKAIAYTGDLDLSDVKLTIEGDDFSRLDETKAGGYPVLTVTDGVLSGTPDLVAAPLPENWAYRQRGNSIRLCFLKGTLLLVK